MFRHGAFILGGKEGAFQMDAQQRGASRWIGHGRPGLGDALQGLRLGIRKDAAQPASDPVGGEKPSDPAKARLIRAVHVHPVSPMGMDIHKPRDQQLAVQVHLLGIRDR